MLKYNAMLQFCGESFFLNVVFFYIQSRDIQLRHFAITSERNETPKTEILWPRTTTIRHSNELVPLV